MGKCQQLWVAILVGDGEEKGEQDRGRTVGALLRGRSLTSMRSVHGPCLIFSLHCNSASNKGWPFLGVPEGPRKICN